MIGQDLFRGMRGSRIVVFYLLALQSVFFSVNKVEATGLNPTFTAVSSASVSVTWIDVPGASFIKVLSTAPIALPGGYTSIRSSQIATGNTFSYSNSVATGASAGWFFQVKIATETDANFVQNAISTVPGASFGPPPPNFKTALNPMFTMVSTVAIAGSWTAVGTGTYSVVVSTNGFLTNFYSAATTGTSVNFNLGVLGTNPAIQWVLAVRLSTETGVNDMAKNTISTRTLSGVGGFPSGSSFGMACPAIDQSISTYTLNGLMKVGQSTFPVAEARVELRRVDCIESQPKIFLTNADGQFLAGNLSTGSYNVNFFKFGWNFMPNFIPISIATGNITAPIITAVQFSSGGPTLSQPLYDFVQTSYTLMGGNTMTMFISTSQYKLDYGGNFLITMPSNSIVGTYNQGDRLYMTSTNTLSAYLGSNMNIQASANSNVAMATTAAGGYVFSSTNSQTNFAFGGDRIKFELPPNIDTYVREFSSGVVLQTTGTAFINYGQNLNLKMPPNVDMTISTSSFYADGWMMRSTSPEAGIKFAGDRINMKLPVGMETYIRERSDGVMFQTTGYSKMDYGNYLKIEPPPFVDMIISTGSVFTDGSVFFSTVQFSMGIGSGSLTMPPSISMDFQAKGDGYAAMRSTVAAQMAYGGFMNISLPPFIQANVTSLSTGSMIMLSTQSIPFLSAGVAFKPSSGTVETLDLQDRFRVSMGTDTAQRCSLVLPTTAQKIMEVVLASKKDADDTMKVTIPPGSLSRSVDLEIKETTSVPSGVDTLGAPVLSLGKAIEINPSQEVVVGTTGVTIEMVIPGGGSDADSGTGNSIMALGVNPVRPAASYRAATASLEQEKGGVRFVVQGAGVSPASVSPFSHGTSSAPSTDIPSLSLSRYSWGSQVTWGWTTNETSNTTFTIVTAQDSNFASASTGTYILNAASASYGGYSVSLGTSIYWSPYSSIYFKIKISSEGDLGYDHNLVSSTSWAGVTLNAAATSITSSTLSFGWNNRGSYVAVLSSGSTIISSGTLNPESTSYSRLSADTAYTFKVKYYSLDDTAYGYNTVSATTLAGPGSLTGLSPYFSSISSGSLTVGWTSPSSASGYIAVLSTSSNFIGSQNSSGSFSTTGVTYSNLSRSTTYYFEVKVSTEIDDAYSYNRISTTTTRSRFRICRYDTATGTWACYMTRFAAGGVASATIDHFSLYQLMSVGDTGVASIGGGTNTVTDPAVSASTTVAIVGKGNLTVEVPAGAFSEAVTIGIAYSTTGFSSAGSNAASLTGMGVGVVITLDKTIQPSQECTLTVPYAASDVGVLNEDRLILARYDDTKGVWVPLVSTVDKTNRQVTARTNHFSTFQIMQVNPSASVQDAKVFPNPFRPPRGHTGITFANLPADASIKIYTLTGSLVRELTVSASGLSSWDAKNESGESVASGVYFALIEGAGGKKTLKVAIER